MDAKTTDLNGKICTRWMRENPLGGKTGPADAGVQTRANRDDVAADRSWHRERKHHLTSLQRSGDHSADVLPLAERIRRGETRDGQWVRIECSGSGDAKGFAGTERVSRMGNEIAGQEHTVNVQVLADAKSLGDQAATHAADSLRQILQRQGRARIVAATGASQFEFLATLTSAPLIDWSKVEMFHLDEYVGLPVSHSASFGKYLQERLIQKTGILKYHLLRGDGDIPKVVQSVGQELTSAPIDLAFVGIGENGHLAFNDPPADFETEEPYLVVELAQLCRQQQVNEGWFATLEDVPRQAISMSIRQIMKAREIIAIVGGDRKARAVQACLEGEVSPATPASILQTHNRTTIYLDRESAALLGSQLTTSP